MKRTPWILLAALVLIGAGTLTGGRTQSLPPAAPCEPLGDLDLYARTISRTDLESASKVLVELTIFSRVALPFARVHGSLAGGAGFDEAFHIPDAVVPLRRGAVRKFQYELMLERGRVHHLFFTVGEEGDPGSARESSAYLRVNLDPARQPEDLGDILQFRARMRGEVAP